jgi:hypothetical protein
MPAPTPAPVAPPAMQGPNSRPLAGPDPSLRPDLAMRHDSERRHKSKPAKPAKPRRHGLYAAAWACSGLIAGTYVFALILRQDGGPFLVRTDAVETAALAKTNADIAQIKTTMGQLGSDVARIKIDQAQADEREKQLLGRVTTFEGRVATVETRVNQFGEQIAAAVAPTKQASAPAAAPAPAKTTAARIATAAIPQPAVSTPAAAPVTGDASAGVLLARGPSLDALRLSWSLLNERHKGTLKAMEPRVVEVEPGSYQLVAGPVANPAEALKVCSALKARGVSCQATDFRGNAL